MSEPAAAGAARGEHGRATHDELVAAVAALLAAARRASAPTSAATRSWRTTRLAALGLAPRRR